MNTVAIDASIAAAWLLPDERTAATDAVLNDLASKTAFVPSIFWHEVRNILVVAERRKRIRADQALRLIERLGPLKLQDAGHGRNDAVLLLARTHALTAYDAAYLNLAVATASSLLTLDKKLAAAAKLEGVSVLGPLSE